MYVKMSEEEDNRMADRWQKDAEGILFFVRLHLRVSATTHQLGSHRLVCSLLL
jgi:hypothetical protein